MSDDKDAYDYGVDRDMFGRPVLTALYVTLLGMVSEEAERRAKLREIVRAALAEQEAPASCQTAWAFPAAVYEPFLQADYAAAPVNGGPIALMRRGGWDRLSRRPVPELPRRREASFWTDLGRHLEEPEFRRSYIEETLRIQAAGEQADAESGQ